MSDLAFNANGESFEVPAAATAWRVRRMKPRGAPELVYGHDGRPLVLPIDADIEEMREAVDATGKYRLDALDEDGKCIENVSPAYIQVTKAAPDAADGAVADSTPPTACDETVREAMRLNTALAKSVVDRFPEMMLAAAELLRAADGAGLPARVAGVIDVDEEPAEPSDASPPQGFDLNAIVGQVVTTLVTGLVNGSVKLPGLAGVLDWRKATAELPQARDPKPTRPEAKRQSTKTAALPPLDPATMAHFVAIQAALTPEEATLAKAVAAELSPAELRAWFDELSKLSVPDAVVKVRGQIAGAKGGVS